VSALDAWVWTVILIASAVCTGGAFLDHLGVRRPYVAALWLVAFLGAIRVLALEANR
jgi:hypothetical protein